ncbi:hypothetical protein [Vreelandella titanicae]|uniref:hypothetical protein n=1 Tax=Vreelandella titanicae TaxID=664683 RepID=UPI00167FE5B0|nr:hypothetical protein [Halomonas titanicae]QNU63758.1 hypothetical protein HZS52_05245 [Halomonas titanicae]
MSYQPSIEDIAYLAQNQPEHFTSHVNTLRSIQNAMQADEVQRETLEAITTQNHYNDFLANGGEALTESPILSMPLPVLEGRPQAQDPEFGAVCTVCASQTPCIEKVEVVCHSGSNNRVTLQGENELVDTDCKIYFVADKAVSGELSFEGFLQGTTFKDEGTVTITLADDCPHDAHRLSWTEALNGTSITSGAEIPFTVETNPRPTLLNIPRLGDYGLAFEAATIILDIIMNRAVMVKEEQFKISYDGTQDFFFTSVTVPSLKFAGKVSLQPPQIGTENIPRSEARRLREGFGMGSNPRQVTHEQGWQIDAQIDVTCGSNTKKIEVGKYRSETTTYDSAPSLRDQDRSRQQSSSVDRFIDSLSNGAKSLAKRLSTEHDNRKLVNLYTVGPKLGLEAGTKQVEETNEPGLTWELEVGLSIDFAFGVKVDIYQALKRSLRRLPVVTPLGGAAHALLVFLEDAEKGRNWGVARYQINPFLFIDVALGAGFKASEDNASSDNMLNGVYDFFEREFGEESIQGQIEIKLTAKAVGGIMGYFDSIITEERVFRYEAEIATEGGIRIKTDGGHWGYQLYHKGAALKIKSFKKVNVESGRDQPADGGRPSPSSNSRQTVLSTTSIEWVEDSENTNTYPLAEGYTGEFIPFS